MKTIKTLGLSIFVVLIFMSDAKAQNLNTEHDKMQWFKDAKLGIFIHYGIYAVDDGEASWPFYNGDITYEDYMKQLDGFTASQYM